MSGDRSINVRGNVSGSSLATGDHSSVTTTTTKVALPRADEVDVRAEIAAIREILARTAATKPLIAASLDEAEAEATKSEPDRAEVGTLLDQALTYTQKAGALADQSAKLVPHVRNVAGWLGQHGPKLLGYVDLSV